MIGNDLVDLRAAAKESNWRRPGYLQKIFTRDEQLQIKNANDPDLLVWIFWSMKEAAYKANQRKFGLGRKFDPSGIACTISLKNHNSASGKVRINNTIYHSKTLFKDFHIHTTATASAATRIFSKIYPSSENIKERMLEEISTKWGLPQSFFSIEKTRNAVPVLRLRDQLTNFPFSISHHGNYSAFSLPLMKD